MERKHTLTINKGRITEYLLLITFGLLCANMTGIFMTLHMGHDYIYGLVPLFDFDLEANIPSFFSALLLLLTSVITGFIAWLKKRGKNRGYYLWLGIAFGFLLLSLDEAVGIHELLTTPLGHLFSTSPIWATLPLLLLLLGTTIYGRFMFQLPSAIRNGLIIAAIIYLGGAIGIDIFGSSHLAHYGARNLVYMIYYTIEELMEMCGVIGFIYSFLNYIELEYKELRIDIIHYRP